MTATFASYAAVAIENARLYDMAQEQAYASAALLQIAQAIVDSDNIDQVLASIARMAPILVGVKSCAIFLREQEVFKTSQAYNLPKEVESALLERSFSAGEFTILDAVLERKGVVVGLLESDYLEDWLDTTLALTNEDAFYAMEVGDHLILGFPLMVKNDFYGVMLVEEKEELRRFRNKRVEIMNSIAQQVALSLENAHLQREQVVRERLEHEVNLARQIQQTFIPERLPELPGWELAACWLTARQVGGDFYDVFELTRNSLGLLIADVSDKGIPAALFMALTRTLVRAAVYDTSSPAEVLRRVNNLIMPDNQQSMFVTAVYAVLNTQTGLLTYTNAGHNPPIWFCSEKGSLEVIQRTGMALGVMDDISIDERSVQLKQGDSLLLYTDGLTDAFSPQGEAFGDGRLKDLLLTHQEKPAKELMKDIVAEVDKFSGHLPLADDLTMLALKRM